MTDAYAILIGCGMICITMLVVAWWYRPNRPTKDEWKKINPTQRMMDYGTKG